MHARHRIRTLDFDLTFTSGALAESQGEPLRTLVVDRLLPVVAAVFDDAAPQAGLYRIDRLDVDLGDVAVEELPEALADRLSQALGHALAYRTDAGTPDHAPDDGRGGGRGEGSVDGSVDERVEGARDSLTTEWPERMARLPHALGSETMAQPMAGARAPKVGRFTSQAAADVADLMAFLADARTVTSDGASRSGAASWANDDAATGPRPEERQAADSDNALDRLLTRVAAGDVQAVRQHLRATATPETSIRRLTQQFSLASIDALIRALHPARAGGWLRELDTLDRMLAHAGWNTASRAQAQRTSRARLIASGLFPSGAAVREMPWHEVWQAVLSTRGTRTPARDSGMGRLNTEAADRLRTLMETEGKAGRASEFPAPMLDALRRTMRSQAGSESHDGDEHEQGAEARPQASLGASSETPGKALAIAMTRGRAQRLYGAWPQILISDPGLLRAAIRHYASLPDLRERMALTFPVSMLEDMLSVLLRQALKFDADRATTGNARGRHASVEREVTRASGIGSGVSVGGGGEATSTGDAGAGRRAGFEVLTTHDEMVNDAGGEGDGEGAAEAAWRWRRNWSRDVASLLQLAATASTEPLVPAGVSGTSSTFEISEVSETIETFETLGTFESSAASASSEPLDHAARSETTPVSGPTSDTPLIPTFTDSIPTLFVRALLSGSSATLWADWQRWVSEDSTTMATLWRHYGNIDTVLTRVVDGFPEEMLAELARLLAPSLSPLWHTFSAISVDGPNRKVHSTAYTASGWNAVDASALNGIVDADIDTNANADTNVDTNVDTIMRSRGGWAERISSRGRGNEPQGNHAAASDRPFASGAVASMAWDQWKRVVWKRVFRHLLDSHSSPSGSPASLAEIGAILRSVAASAWQRDVVDSLFAASAIVDAPQGNVAGPECVDVSPPASMSASQTVAEADGGPVERLRRLIRRRNEIVSNGGNLVEQAARLSGAQRAALERDVAGVNRILTRVAAEVYGLSGEGGDGSDGSDNRAIDRSGDNHAGAEKGRAGEAEAMRVVDALSVHDWRAVVDTMIAVSHAIPAVHRDLLHRSIADHAPDADDIPRNAVTRYYASVAAALARDATLELDALSEAAVAAATVATVAAVPPGPSAETRPHAVSRRSATPDGYIDHLRSPALRAGHPPPPGFDLWLRQSVYSGAPSLRPIIALAADDEVLTGRWLDLIPQPLWPGIARLSPRDTPQVAQMLRVATDVAEWFATMPEAPGTLMSAELQRARWAFLFSWLFTPQRPFDASIFARSLVTQLAHRANVAVSPALAVRIQQQTGIDMGTSPSNPHETSGAPVDAVVRHAGLVLTWPFLSHLWSYLGLTAEHRFVDEAAAQRAVLLLHYVGTGLTEVPEYELTIHKLLCGAPFTTPVTRHLDITDDEARICDQMIDAMIRHWSALGNTSRAGLRETFLQREGRLSLAQDGWHLDVRRIAFDVLLARLPWSISTIRLSWMEKTIWVNWT
ncbi:hypothetical protein AB870_25915 [Pandoraea faecigallinarum]|uniref:Uncharacterized protein n=1 Tax=Pandoraea faecigallinarum TaxID=656179 RepID=A0A173GZX0_9BURK|nr:contractile injection system tape measure protein [Pandoraea faecigallinarum]ANI21724.1 hypothetical protein AB870_25915 [Pandoraea faecigallinarum]